MQVGAIIAPLFALFCALSILGVCRDRTFNAVVAGSIPARLTIVFNVLMYLLFLSDTMSDTKVSSFKLN